MRSMTTFGENLRKARKEAGYTQDELAQRLGMLRTNYVPYETGKKHPDEEYWPVLAKELRIPVQRIEAWIIVDKVSDDLKPFLLEELNSL